jgi:hypothetical protein
MTIEQKIALLTADDGAGMTRAEAIAFLIDSGDISEHDPEYSNDKENE